MTKNATLRRDAGGAARLLTCLLVGQDGVEVPHHAETKRNPKMNEINPADKAVVINALLRLVGDEVLTPLEKRDIIHEITNLLTGFNIADMVNDTKNRRRLRLGTYNPDASRLSREVLIDREEKSLRVTGDTPEEDFILGTGDAKLPTDMDYVVEFATGLSGQNYINGWYRKYKSGWVEQGGVLTGNGTNIIFQIPMQPGYAWQANLSKIQPYIYQSHCGDPSSTGLLECSEFYMNNASNGRIQHWETNTRWEVKGMSA
jgi:hypothetical protein